MKILKGAMPMPQMIMKIETVSIENEKKSQLRSLLKQCLDNAKKGRHFRGLEFIYDKASELFNKKDHEGAIRLCIDALGYYPNDIKLWGALSDSFVGLGMEKEASACQDSQISLFPNRPKGWDKVRGMKPNNPDYEKAIKFWDELERMNPDMF